MAKQITCPACAGKVVKNTKPKESKGGNGFFQKLYGCLKSVMDVVEGALDTVGLNFVDITSIRGDNKCSVCKGTKKIDDPADTSKRDQAVAAKVQAAAPQIQALEARMGPPGGNKHTLVTGDEMLEVGIGFNKAKSYEIKKGKGAVQSGGAISKDGTHPDGDTSDHVQGRNPIAYPGGNYVIKAANKMTVFTGAQGFGVHTHGPITMKGGITHISGPEVTVGTAAGKTTIEGGHLELTGKSISISPNASGKGQVSIKGTLYTQGNLIAQGGAHIEGDLSCISMTMPSKIERSEVGSSAPSVTGMARWGTKCSMQAMLDFVRQLQMKLADPGMMLVSPRGIQQIMELVQHLAEKTIPIEMQQTGIAIGFGYAAVYNYPHHHILHDDDHAHDNKVPNIKLVDDDKAVRGLAGGKAERTPVPANKSGSNVLKKIWKLITGVFAMAGVMKQMIK